MIDHVVFPPRVDGERYVGEVVDLLSKSEFKEFDAGRARCGVVEKDSASVY